MRRRSGRCTKGQPRSVCAGGVPPKGLASDGDDVAVPAAGYLTHVLGVAGHDGDLISGG